MFDHIVAPELAFTHGFDDGIVAGLKQSTQFVPGSRCREFCQVDDILASLIVSSLQSSQKYALD